VLESAPTSVGSEVEQLALSLCGYVDVRTGIFTYSASCKVLKLSCQPSSYTHQPLVLYLRIMEAVASIGRCREEW